MNPVLIPEKKSAAGGNLKPGILDYSAGPRAAPPRTGINVLLADDHPLMRNGIKQCINDSPGMQVVGEAGTAAEVLEFLGRSECDVLVLDIDLPDRSGLEVLRILNLSHPALPKIMLSQYSENQFSPFCLRAGAAGFLNKANAASQLVDAIRKAARGGLA